VGWEIEGGREEGRGERGGLMLLLLVMEMILNL